MNKPVFPPEYFYDEVRDGFFVPEMMKRFWAAQLVVLYEVVKICDRHDISWYLDMGSLIGAVRHRGYVPWDDDLDISMNRDDWEKFFEVAQNELPEGYCVLSPRTKKEYTLSLGRITNSCGINTHRDHMDRYYGCPYVAGVDIFPIDRLYKDPEKEQERKMRGKAIQNVIDLINSNGLNDKNVLSALKKIEIDNGDELSRDDSLGKELVLLFEKICMECNDNDYEEVAFMATWILGDWANCPRRVYDERREFVFENNILMGTTEYDELLTIYYQDYMTVKKGGGVHEYPVYKDQENILSKSLGHNPYRYTFDKSDLANTQNRKKTLERCCELLEVIRQSVKLAEHCKGMNDVESAYNLLCGCQNSAIALGTMIENKYGESCSVVKHIEDYCELLYLATQHWEEGTTRTLDNAVERIGKEMNTLIHDSKKKIVFLPCRKEWWDTMSWMYENIVSSEEYDVKLMPVKYFDSDPYGGMGMCHDDCDFYKGYKEFISENEFDIEKKHPDIIVTQVPFDGYSGAMTLSEKYYSERLLECCDELWYVPCYAPDAPESPDDKAAKAISVLIEQPVVMRADRVMVHDEKLRLFYINRLTELVGEDMREYLEKKVTSNFCFTG